MHQYLWIVIILANIKTLIVCLALGISQWRTIKTWILELWQRVNVPNALDGAIMPGSALPRTSREKGARDSKARVHSPKGDPRDLQLRDPILLEKVFKMAKWDLGDQKGDPKDLLFVLNVASLATNKQIVELGLMKVLNNQFLQWVGYG